MLLLLLASTLILSGCGSSPLSFLTGGGPNVAANTQLGETNSQTLGTSENTSIDVRGSTGTTTVTNDKSEVKVDNGNVVVNKNEVDPLLVLLLILGWLAPSPAEIGRSIVNLFKRKS